MSPPQFISTVSIWYVTRTAILRDMPPALATGAPEFTLTDDINSLIDAYLDIMQPKLQDTVDRIARKVQGYTAKKDVVAMVGERLGTPGPADLFNILNEHLKLAKDGAQKVLQRRLLFDVNMNLKLYAETILSTIEERWRTAQDIYDDKDSEGVGLLCALVNDFGVGLDHMEALEATYADAIGSSITFMGDGAPGAGALDRRGSMDNAAAEDQLATRRKLMVTGNKLLEHLVAVLAVEFGPPLGKAFTDEWLMGQYVQTVMSTITDYFNDFQRWLDVYWCQHLAVLTAERVRRAAACVLCLCVSCVVVCAFGAGGGRRECAGVAHAGVHFVPGAAVPDARGEKEAAGDVQDGTADDGEGETGSERHQVRFRSGALRALCVRVCAWPPGRGCCRRPLVVTSRAAGAAAGAPRELHVRVHRPDGHGDGGLVHPPGRARAVHDALAMHGGARARRVRDHHHDAAGRGEAGARVHADGSNGVCVCVCCVCVCVYLRARLLRRSRGPRAQRAHDRAR